MTIRTYSSFARCRRLLILRGIRLCWGCRMERSQSQNKMKGTRNLPGEKKKTSDFVQKNPSAQLSNLYPVLASLKVPRDPLTHPHHRRTHKIRLSARPAFPPHARRIHSHGIPSIFVFHELILSGDTVGKHLLLQSLRNEVVAVVVLCRAGVGYAPQYGIRRHGKVAKSNWFPNGEHLDLGVRRVLQDRIGCRGPLQAPASSWRHPEHHAHLTIGGVERLAQVVYFLRIEFDESRLSRRRVPLGTENAVDAQKKQDGDCAQYQQAPHTLCHSTTPTPRNTSPPDDAPQWPTSTAPGPAENPTSAVHLRSPLASAIGTILSGPPGSGTPDSQTNNEIHGTSGETNLKSVPHPRRRCRVPRAFSCAEARPGPQRFPRRARADKDISCTRPLQTASARQEKLFRPW